MSKFYLYEMIEYDENDDHHTSEYFSSKKEMEERIKQRMWDGRHGSVERNTIILPSQAWKINHSSPCTKTDFKELETENKRLRNLLSEVKKAANF